MPWRGPEHPDDFPSLGWELLDWFAEFLPSPRDPSKSLLFTDEQAMQIVEWFRIDPVAERLAYRRGYSRRSKGWGKSPVEGAKAIGEFAGPVRFAGWDAKGEPVGMPWGVRDAPRAWVQIGAISEDQTDNTWSVIHYLLTENDGKCADALGIDAGLTRCFLRGQPGAKLEPVTSAAGSREGQPITYGVIDESHLMVPSNGGVKLARTIRRNVAKMGGRSYETTNSYLIGHDSVAEESHKAVLAGSPGIFADEVEAPHEIDGVEVDPSAPDDVLRAALAVAYGKSWWVDLDRLVADVRDPSNTWEDSARFFFNWPQAENSAGAIPSWATLIDLESVISTDRRWALAVSPDRKWAAIGVAGHRADGKIHVGWARHQSGTDWVIDEVVSGYEADKNPIRIHTSGPEAAFIAPLRAAGVEVEEVTTTAVAQATGQIIDAANNGTLCHRGQPSLDKAVKGAVLRLGVDGAATWSQKMSSIEITPLQAVTVAIGGVPSEKPVDVLANIH
jgi:hypothetical protein